MRSTFILGASLSCACAAGAPAPSPTPTPGTAGRFEVRPPGASITLGGGADDCGLRQPDDVVQAVSWLASQPGVDPARVLVPGAQHGFSDAEEALVRPVVDEFLSRQLR